METPCINWTGAVLQQTGYGQKCLWENGKQRTVRVHRWVWEQAHGPVPKGLLVMHECDNKLCMNLEHLRLGTTKENTQQAYDRGLINVAKGERHRLAKLTTETVREIRKLYAAGINLDVLAKRYEVGRTTVSSVVNFKTWKHVG